MVVGVDDAAAVAGFLSLTVTLVAGCIKGFVILSDAWRCGTEADFVECLLQVEQHRFVTWAEAVGLLDEPPRLAFDAETVRQIQSILRGLDGLFSDAQELRKRYKLDLRETGEDMTQLQLSDTVWSTMMSRERPELQERVAKVFRKRNGPWKRLRWVVVDADRARKLVEVVGKMIDYLEGFLSRDQNRRQTSSLEGMVRLLIVLSTDVQDLKVIAQREQCRLGDGAVAATAQCKQEGLSLGVLKRSDSDDSTLALSASTISLQDQRSEVHIRRSLRLDDGLVKIDASFDRLRQRTLAFYDNEPTLIEWKPASSKSIINMRYRVERVTAFLNGLSHPSFHTLQCRGYFWDRELSRYGYVFNLPYQLRRNDSLNAHNATAPQLCTLKERFRHESMMPSLNKRISWAICLMETVLQLHTSGFLHKEIRSDNVLFFREDEKTTSLDVDELGPYLAGYVYARADNPLEATESPESVFEANLYRHPSALGGHRPPYRKTFDLFSIGCVLLELGLWARLSGILLSAVKQENGFVKCSSPLHRITTQTQPSSEHRLISDAKQQLCDPKFSSHLERWLQATAGVAYADVAMTCLHADTTRQSQNPEDDVFSDHTLEVHEKSLAQLRSISI